MITRLSRVTGYRGLTGCLAAILLHAAAYAQDDGSIYFDIDAQSLPTALEAYGLQSNSEVLFAGAEIKDKKTSGIEGHYTKRQAIALLLDGTGVDYRTNEDGTLIVGAAHASRASGSSDSEQTAGEKEDGAGEDNAERADDDVKELIELRNREVMEEDAEKAREFRGLTDVIVVVGSRNAGIRRFEDDPQPYIVFNADDLQNSSARNLEEFFRTRLPQNTAQTSNQQFNSFAGRIGNTSSINLRGLGADQTLILVNGRRAPRVSADLTDDATGGFTFQQADVNGIPMASIERIEVLPSTASGIYGGGATGGVINIITRRDFRGGEFQVLYGDTDDGSFAEYEIDASYGLALEGGRTNILLTGSYSGSGDLLAGERDFGQDSLNLLLANDPEAYYELTTPPLASTPNIRSSLDGNLVLDDGTDLGSPITFVPVGYAGVASDGGQALIDNAGRYSTAPAPDLNGEFNTIRQSPEIYSAAFSIRREFTPDLELFLDTSFSSNEGQRKAFTNLPRSFMPGGVPGNPFQGPVTVTYPVTGTSFETTVTQESLSYVAGGTYTLPRDWSVSADYNWSRARTEQIGTSPGFDIFLGINPAIDTGTLDIFRDTVAFPLDLSEFEILSPNNIIGPRDSVLRNAAIRISGPAFRLPAGAINIAALVETRDEILEDYYTESYNFFSGVPGELNTLYIPEREQSTDSIYLEALIPIFSAANSLPFIRSLELQLSGRYDDYTTEAPSNLDQFAVEARGDIPVDPIETNRNEFDSFDYTVGLRYAVSEDVLFRSSFGTGFLPPSVSQIFRQIGENFRVLGNDPKRGGSFFLTQDATVFFGGNPDLLPEESESWSVGTILTPRFLPGFRLSLDYSVTEKENEIRGADNQLILDNEDLFPDRIVRADLTQADIDAGYTGGVILSLDRSLINFAETKSEALDVQLDQVVETDRYGNFRFYAVATRMFNVEERATPDSEVVDRVGFDGGPLGWRANFGFNWDSPGSIWSLGWNAQYYDSYYVYPATASEFIIEQNTRQQGSAKIPSETYHDFFAVHRLTALDGAFSGLFENLDIRFSIQNVFDKTPTIRPGFSPTQGRFSPYGDNRLRRFTLSLRKNF